MGKESRLGTNGEEYRAEKISSKNKYVDEENVYSADNIDAMAHDDSPLGKGTGKSMGYAVRELDAPKTKMNYNNIDTSEAAGGYYDKNGTKGVNKAFQGDSGREWGKTINIFNKENAYGPDSVAIDETVKGQFITK